MIDRLYQAYLRSHTVTTDSRAITPGCLYAKHMMCGQDEYKDVLA